MGSAMLVCQGLIEAEGFKQSRGKWGEGTRKLPEQDSLWGCHLDSKGTKASSVSSAKLLVHFLCAPHPSLRGSRCLWTHQEAQATQFPAGALFTFKKSSFPL